MPGMLFVTDCMFFSRRTIQQGDGVAFQVRELERIEPCLGMNEQLEECL